MNLHDPQPTSHTQNATESYGVYRSKNQKRAQTGRTTRTSTGELTKMTKCAYPSSLRSHRCHTTMPAMPLHSHHLVQRGSTPCARAEPQQPSLRASTVQTAALLTPSCLAYAVSEGNARTYHQANLPHARMIRTDLKAPNRLRSMRPTSGADDEARSNKPR